MTDQIRRPHRPEALNELRGELVRVAHSESQQPRTRFGRQSTILMVMAAWLVAGGTAAIVVGGNSHETAAPQPGSVLKEVYTFDSLPQMLATSDVVVEGTVTNVQPGRVVGGDVSKGTAAADESAIESSGAVQFNQVALSVDRQLYGKAGAKELVVEEERGLGLQGTASQVGNHGVYFLHQKVDAPGYYRLINSQGRFLAVGTDQLAASNDQADWVRAIESESLSQLEDQIVKATAAVKRGTAQPATPVK